MERRGKNSRRYGAVHLWAVGGGERLGEQRDGGAGGIVRCCST